MAQVVIEQLTKEYPRAGAPPMRALDALSLSVEDGEVLAVVGPSGAGKTTLLRVIAGLEEATGGTIRIGGEVVNDRPAAAREVGMVFQRDALFPHLTVRENLGLGLKLRKFPKTEIESRVNAAAELLGLTPLLERKPGLLSGGERQRVSLGRAMARQPKLLLLDEPLSSLDPPLRRQLRLELTRLRERSGTTMIHVTHDQAEALTLGDRVAVMNQGKLEQVADPLTLYHQPANLFVAGFIGWPPMNFFPGTLRRQARELVFVAADSPGFSVRVPEERAGQPGDCLEKTVLLGLRPEDIGVAAQPAEAGVRARVELVERLGAETHVRFNAGGSRGVLRAGGDDLFSVGQELTLCFEMNKAHFFPR